ASVDSLPATRAEALSATRALDGTLRAGPAMTTAAMDETLSASGQGSRKSSNLTNQVERQNMESTVRYDVPPRVALEPFVGPVLGSIRTNPSLGTQRPEAVHQ